MKRLFMTAMVIGLTIACALVFQLFSRDTKDIVVALLRQEQQILAEQASRDVESFFATWIDTLTTLSRMKEIIDVDAIGRRDMQLLFETHRQEISTISRVDERGVIIASYPFDSVTGSTIAEQAHIRNILSDRRPVISHVFRSVQGFDAIAVHVPVFSGPDFRGTIAVLVNFERLTERYFSAIRLGATGYCWVVDSDAKLLYTPIPGLAGTSATQSFRAFPSMLPMLSEMLQGHRGAATYTTKRTRGTTEKPAREYAVYLPIKLENTFWSVAVASEEREVFGMLESVTKRLALAVGLVFAGGLLIVIQAYKFWEAGAVEAARKLSEKELRESEEKYHNLVREASIGIFHSTLEGRFIDVNPALARMLGYETPEEVLASITSIAQQVYADPLVYDAVALQVLTAGGVLIRENRYRRRDGSLWWGLLRLRIVSDKAGQPVCREGFVEDITERKKSEMALLAATGELARSNAELNRFCYSVSHDLQEPLRMVVGYAGLLSKRYDHLLDKDGREFLVFLRQGAERMQSMIEDLLRYSQVTTRGQSFAPVALEEVLTEALMNLVIALEKTGGTVAHEALPIVMGDRSQLVHLFQNLIGNALKFARPGEPPRVAIAARREDPAGRLWTVSVRDNGIGIDPKFFERIFVVFQTLHTGEDYPGTGVGLAICQRIVERHGGRIWVESTPGAGSTFFFTVPTAEGQLPAVASADDEAATSSRLTRAGETAHTRRRTPAEDSSRKID